MAQKTTKSFLASRFKTMEPAESEKREKKVEGRGLKKVEKGGNIHKRRAEPKRMTIPEGEK